MAVGEAGVALIQSETPAHIPRAQQSHPTIPPDVVAEKFSPATGGTPTGSSSSSNASSALPSPNHTSPGGGSLVPAYPYNTNLAPFLAPANGVASTPDDSEVQTNLPVVQVDYLSHEWSEEDVWTSWRATTKHKASIANGLRLENASWRTWNKQRNKLKTISPETLNWLKDSDVTWLYGPLHTKAVEAVPKRKAAAAEDRLGLDRSVSAKARGKQVGFSPPKRAGSISPKPPMIPKKPILKYRSLSDILTVPSSKRLRRGSFDEHAAEDHSGSSTPTVNSGPAAFSDHLYNGSERGTSTTPPSDTASMKSYNSGNSGQRPIIDESDTNAEDTAHTSGDDAHKNGRRKHIAFSHRVEQCIAVDSDEDRERYSSKTQASAAAPKWGSKLQRAKPRHGSYFDNADVSESDESDSGNSSEEEEENVLTFKSSRSHAGSHHSPLGTSTSPTIEPCTIFKLAPTILKGSESLPSPSPAVVFTGMTDDAIDDDEEDEEDTATSITPKAEERSTSPPRPNMLYAQQVMAGSRKHVIIPSDASTAKSGVAWDGEDEDYSSVGVEYSIGAGISGQDGDFALSDAAYSMGDTPSSVSGSSSLYASYDPIPRGHYTAQIGRSPPTPTINLAEEPFLDSQQAITPPSSAAQQKVQPGKSILKPYNRAPSDSSISSQSNTPSPVATSPSIPQAASTEDEYEARGRPLSRGSSTSSLDARSRTASGGTAGSSNGSSPISPTLAAQRPPKQRRRDDPGGVGSNSDLEHETSADYIRDGGDSDGSSGKARGESYSRRNSHQNRYKGGRSNLNSTSRVSARSTLARIGLESSEPVFPPILELDDEPNHRPSSSLALDDSPHAPMSAARAALLRSTGSSYSPPDSGPIESFEHDMSPLSQSMSMMYSQDSSMVGRAVEVVSTARDVIEAFYAFGSSLLWRPRDVDSV